MGNLTGQVFEAAVRANAEGRLDDADDLARKVLSVSPNDSQALLLLGIVNVKRQNPAVAVPALRTVLESDPDSFDAAFWLSMVFRKIGRSPDALIMAEQAVDANPKSEHAHNQLGMCQLDMGRAQEAVQSFSEAARLDPETAPFFDNLGRALQAVGRHEEAILAYRRVLAIGPVRDASLYRLGDAMMMIPDVAGAAHCAREILKLDPRSAPGHLLLARAFIGSGQIDEAVGYALKASELAPGNPAPVAYYGRALQALGQIQEADEQFRRSIAMEPRQGFAYHALVHNHKVKEEERPMVERMVALAQDKDLPKREIIQLEYGLGKAFEDLGEYEAAMAHFDEANRQDHLLKVGIAPFDKAALERWVSDIIAVFDDSFLDANRLVGLTNDLPIFVVGMMRSGTTLAEQIISSHPDVGGAGEQLFWPEVAGSREKLFGSGAPSVDLARFRGVAEEYLKVLKAFVPGKPKVVDKMNTNYLLLGLLNVLYPNAKIIHMKRSPIDTCLSIWKTPVANGIDLCGSKENVVAAYEQYVRLMAHWRHVLPAGSMLEVKYEELVADQETVTRRMISFCGLDWDDACLKPEENERSVKTPSVWQVRQPMYNTSVERWRKYEPWLGAFAELQSLEV